MDSESQNSGEVIIHIYSWTPHNYDSLKKVQEYALSLQKDYNIAYFKYTNDYKKYNIPITILSAIAGSISIIGPNVLSVKMYKYITIAGGIISLVVALLSSVRDSDDVLNKIDSYKNGCKECNNISNDLSYMSMNQTEKKKIQYSDYIKDIFSKLTSIVSAMPITENIIPFVTDIGDELPITVDLHMV